MTDLVHHERGDLSLEHLHALRGDDGAHFRHGLLGEHLVDEAVVPLEPCRGNVLHRKAVVLVWGQEIWIGELSEEARRGREGKRNRGARGRGGSTLTCHNNNLSQVSGVAYVVAR